MRIYFSAPHFFPSLQFFYALAHSDLWVVLDHQNFRSRSFQNACKLKSDDDNVQLIRIPIMYPAKQPLHQIAVNNYEPWKRVFLSILHKNYENTEFYPIYIDDVKSRINGPSILLETLNMDIILWISGLLKISPSFLQSRILYTKYPKSKVIKTICSRYNAEQFKKKIKIAKNNREKNLSALDYLFRTGADNVRRIIYGE